MTADRRQNHTERDARQRWCDTRRPGDPVAVFTARNTIRCPGTNLRNGQSVVCGRGRDIVGDGFEVTVVAAKTWREMRRLVRNPAGMYRLCDCCGAHLALIQHPARAQAS